MARQMANKQFRDDQWNRRFDPHIVDINFMVDDMRKNQWAPYVAPMYGGVNARLLSVLRDPGPKTQDDVGSGFLCMENDDPTAETMCGLFAGVNIGANEIVPWNAYPWYINRHPNSKELGEGVEPLKQIIDLLPKLEVVMLHGGAAHVGWKRLVKRHPRLVAERNLLVIQTYHTSRQAFWHSDPEVREARKQHLQDAFKTAAQRLGI